MRSVCLVICVVAAVACKDSGDRPRPEPTHDRPNVILIVIDTLRADHLGVYGHSRDTAPFLRSLAERGVRFDAAYSSASWTVPAVASLLTGVYPQTHRVQSGLGGNLAAQQMLPASLSSLPEVMDAAGYDTYAAVANVHLKSRFGYARGFNHFVFDRSTERIAAQVKRWSADDMGKDNPYFLWVHLMDPHHPYRPREPWISKYFDGHGPLSKKLDLQSPKIFLDMAPAGSRELEYLQAAYDSEIRGVDDSIRQMLEDLAPSSKDLIVVVSDHGEEFREHGAFGHGNTLYDETTRVPLIVKFPGRAPGAVHPHPVSIVDIYPTVLDVTGKTAPHPLHGVSLAGALEDGGQSRAVLSAISHDNGRRQTALVTGKHKLIQRREPSGAESTLLFDLAADPREQDDLSASEPQTVAALAAQLAAFERRVTVNLAPTETKDYSEDELTQLEELGYVESDDDQ